MNIADARKAAGFSTQEQLANYIKVSRSTIAKLEAGICVPRWKTLKLIANALNCSVDDLLSDTANQEDEIKSKVANEIEKGVNFTNE
ncbi:MAG: helix-turn-helix domain-containing protein [Oscillospiraceae bacterium]|nr:helix-turn-helix domain-containing protein [Oscillospiraceae bacterium]